MDDLLPAVLVILVGGALAAAQMSRLRADETPLMALAFLAHVVSAFVQVWFTRTLYGWGDLFGYSLMGEGIAALLRADFAQFGPEVVRLLFHEAVALPVDVAGPGSSSGAMAAAAGLLTYFTGGSTYTLCLVFSIAAYFGQSALYRAFRLTFPAAVHGRLLFAAMLVPSAVFWSSALLKEAISVAGLGYLVLGTVEMRRQPNVAALLRLVAGGITVALFKSYILFAFVAAAGAWLYAESSAGRAAVAKPVYLVLGGAVAIVGIMLLGRVFPEYALDTLADKAAYYQELGETSVGGSSYSFGDPASATLAGQLAFAPLALITSLFRPFLFEARSPQIFINALETAAVLGLGIRAIVRRGWAGTSAIFAQNSMLLFCLAFSVVFGIAVGLTTTNLGTLSRYRMPLVPFFWALLLVIDAVPSRAEFDAPTRPTPRASLRGLAR